MGLHTKFLGHVRITPPLNAAEERYLRAYSRTRRWDRTDGPYVVLDHPLEEDPRAQDGESYNSPAVGEPGLWCPWEPCLEGCCLHWNGQEKPYDADRWMTYLIEHFLAACALAQGHPGFEKFTFDHEVNGVIFGEGSETREVFAIEVIDNVVRWITLMPGLSLAEAWGMESPEEGIARRTALLGRRDAYRSRTLRA